MNKSRNVCYYVLEKLREDVRWRIVLLSLSLLLFDGVYRIHHFCTLVDTKITPYVFPHMLSAMPLQFTFIIGFLLILCAMPYLDADSTLALTRSGYRTWGCGVLRSIHVVSFIYVMTLLILSIVFLLPSIAWESSWGKVIHTFANTPSVNRGYFRIFYVSDRIVSSYAPIAAMLLSLILEFLCLELLALVMLTVNLWTRGSMGICASLAVAGLDFFVYNDLGDKFIWFSPVSLARLSVLDAVQTSSYPSPFYALAFLVVACIVFRFVALSLFTSKYVS